MIDKTTLDYLESQAGSVKLFAKPDEISNYILLEILKQLSEQNDTLIRIEKRLEINT